jgi:hypothetical protein
VLLNSRFSIKSDGSYVEGRGLMSARCKRNGFD